MNTLRKRIVSGASWTMVGHISGQLLRLASNLIMTRLLVPEMFGIMAIANVIIFGLAMFSDLGVNQNIIQSKRSDSEEFLNTAWVVQICRGIILWIVALMLSWILVVLADKELWPADSVYADPILPYILASLSFSAVISGFSSTKLALAYRNLAIHSAVKIELASQISGILLMILWAYFERTIWALVIGAIFSNFIKTILSHIFLPGYNNKLHFDKESFYELLHFGKWIFLTSILGFMVINGDKLVLGGLITTELLGIYTIAIFIISAIQQIATKVIGSVAYPALSETVRERPGELRTTYYKLRLPVDAAILFSSGILFMAGHHIIDILYDDRYQSAGNMLEILSLLLIAERFALTTQCFIALGKPSYLVPMISTRIPVLYVILPIIYSYYGFDGALWLIALNRIIEWPVLFYLKIKTSLFVLSKELYFMSFLLVGMLVGWVANYII